MSTAAGPWDTLEHAFGPASDLPALLDAVARASGGKLNNRMRDLCDRVLHQGTIYSASPPAVRELIAMPERSNTSDKALFYEVLSEFASSARQAVRDGHATPCCSGGEPADGEAILSEILQARDRFAPDLEHREPTIRGLAASLVVPSADAGPAAIGLVRQRYSVEADVGTRLAMFKALLRARPGISDWREFLTDCLGRESAIPNRCALRRAEAHEWKSETPAPAVEELVAASLQAGDSELYGALQELGEEREIAALLQTVSLATNRDFLRPAALRLLLIVFQDTRTGWENMSYRYAKQDSEERSQGDPVTALFKAAIRIALLLLLGKIFPFLVRRKLRKAAEARAKCPAQIEYWGLEGVKPELPPRLSDVQRSVLRALATKSELWSDSTNLWALFGLPDTADALREFAA